MCENRSSGFPTGSDTNWAVQLQKVARGLKFRIYEVEGLYYLCSENKGADQLRGYREADLRLCFRIYKIRFSHDATRIGLIECPLKIKRKLYESIHKNKDTPSDWELFYSNWWKMRVFAIRTGAYKWPEIPK